jgi:L-ascorbate metabolism protein UlaG (beta-lactamase superfamily)
MAGFLINSRGTTIMIDPLLEGFAASHVPELDAILVTMNSTA